MTTSVETALQFRRDTSLTMLIRQEIERMIDTGELSPGGWINEALLAARLKVSRGPVREACRGLEQSGLVQVIVNRGAFVRAVGAADAQELYQLRAALFGLGGWLLAPNITAEQAQALKSLLDRMDAAAAASDLDAYYPLNLDFHRSILQFSGNGRLLAQYQSLLRELHLFRRRALLSGGRMADSNAEHLAIFEALMAHDAEQARRLMEAHVLAGQSRALSGPG